MKIDYNVLGIFIIVCAIFHIIRASYECLFAKFLVCWYSIGLIIIYFIVINCDMKWKKKE